MLTDPDILELFNAQFELQKLVSRKADLALQLARLGSSSSSVVSSRYIEVQGEYDQICLEAQRSEAKLGGLLNVYVGS